MNGDIQSKSVLVTCIDTATGAPVERWISIPFPGRSYEGLAKALEGEFRQYKKAMITTEAFVNIALVCAIHVQVRGRRRTLAIVAAAALVQAAITLAVLS